MRRKPRPAGKGFSRALQKVREAKRRDSGSDPQGENSRSEVECEASQSGLKGIAQAPGETP